MDGAADHKGSPSTGRILVVDDDARVRRLFRAALESDGHTVLLAEDGDAGLAAVRDTCPDAVLLDADLPGMHGWEVCRQIKSDILTQLIPVLLVTGRAELEDRIGAIQSGADEFLGKPVHVAELKARVRGLVRMKRRTDGLDSAEAAFMALANAIDARDPMTLGHCQRVARHSVNIGRAIGLPEHEQDLLFRGASLHDIGKIAVPDAVLFKPGRLTPEEREVIEKHPTVGDVVCAPLRSLEPVRPIIIGHHERLDGSGYPHGLRGDEVPALAQIVAVADMFDALTSLRHYRTAMSNEQAGAILMEDARAGKLPLAYVEAFLDQAVNQQ